MLKPDLPDLVSMSLGFNSSIKNPHNKISMIYYTPKLCV